jgi:hypothetical protein
MYHNKTPKQYRQPPLGETRRQHRKQYCADYTMQKVMVEPCVPQRLWPAQQAIYKVDSDANPIRVRNDAAPSDQVSVSVIEGASFSQRP